MKKNKLLALTLLVCLAGLSKSYGTDAAALSSTIHADHTWRLKTGHPFCRLTFVDDHGHSVKLNTSVLHASHRSLTFIFEEGEKLVINFTIIRAGHFVAESRRSKDPQILFYPSHSSRAIPMVGSLIISSTKPVSGSFSHLVSDDHEHLTLVSGAFSF